MSLRAPLHRFLLGGDGSPWWVVLVAADLYAGTFASVPLSLLRIEDRPGLFSAYSSARHALHLVLKVWLVWSGFGVAGVLWAELVATSLFSAALLPRLRGKVRLTISPSLLREALAFGLPKVPHGLLVQVQNLADRKILDLFVSRAEVGIYQVGYTFGQAVKFPLSAFEPAWGPFVYSQLGRPDTPLALARVVTYAWSGFLAVALAVAVLGRELLVLMTPRSPAFHAAAPLVPVVALAYLLHGAFLLGSVGIGVSKRARYYPLVTAASAAANVAANLVLIPRMGILGAAWATVVSYAVMAGLGIAVSQRLYPLPFETGRLTRVSAAALLVLAASWLAPAAWGAAVAVKLGLLALFPVLVLASGFLRPGEREWLRDLVRRRLRG